MPTTDRDVAVQADDLTRRFGPVLAVDGLSFHVKRGELFGLVGPDGAGKTTTLRMLSGVLPPSSGDARLGGTSVVEDPEEVKHRIAYMSQRFGLYTDLTVMENLAFYADLFEVPKGEREERLERLFHFSNLGPFRDRLAGALSGGMKQKLGLSCALIHQPEILLLDEPTFGVDPISRRDLWLIVHDMVAEGVTAIVSTAYMDEAERFDRLAFLHRGRVVALGSPDDLVDAMEGELLVITVDRVRQARQAVTGHAAVQLAAVFGDQLHVMVSSAQRDGPAVRSALEDWGFTVSGFQEAEPGLEDVFIHRIARADANAAEERA
ncbi:MAG: ABC transporter ATP-binding protein [Gemmatimonadetes bacterium]|uniref:ABC transporter ATP-binding protein n=1 Tax=Candidatus Kutchimonas denitrificans TaxID=3056748 RepID=A0AAE5C9S9_9BACT|nr:ABC transporter ATP-binding protein [Gemmatimonadota bacterium]NIR75796.1 ABC transporter ATP-binding protein [Candidatus Kutchimonas denitrificans]NIS01964.1 ABC transporter ATP-binding protein [Gemmatimonadota bacterium]NIT67768.1 ABC transporter ATP-binding protein [Gemmatimonadota bacterium]NIU53755.1 ATP-binding cassette domain-containing protein [Gemmatimonadota bacterium]